MYRRLIAVCSRRSRRDEVGVVAIIVALTMTTLAVIAGMVLDFGLLRIDRQVDKSAADSAVTAGLHALKAGDDKPRPFRGVCTALRYLQANDARFANISDSTGTWTTGTGTSAPNGCTDSTARIQICTPGSPSSWAMFTWAGSMGGRPLQVTIQSGYVVSATSGWSEDALSAAVADQDDKAQGCDQLAVSITQSRKPGLGSLATSSDLTTSVRSVGRVSSQPSGYAPALLLLRQSGCQVLQTGSNSGTSHIYVLGAISTDGKTQPGTIHADSSGVNDASDPIGPGSTCGTQSGKQVFLGNALNGIVAFAAPDPLNPILADPAKPGSITSAATANGVSSGIVRDAVSQVCGSKLFATLLSIPLIGCSSPQVDVAGRDLTTRSLIDTRYRAVVNSIVSTSSSVWNLTPATAPAAGWTVVTCSSGVVSPSAALTAATKAYVDCADTKSMPAINASAVFFNGTVSPALTISLPRATKVYVLGSAGNSLNLGSGTFSMHTESPSGATNINTLAIPNVCSDSPTSDASNRAVLLIKNGQIKESNGGLLQMCYTTMVMMGGQSNGCIPSSDGARPTATPCGGGAGTGILSQSGGNTDWTAPNRWDVISDLNSIPDPVKSLDWSSVDGPEDLAFWSESYGTGPDWNMNGQSLLHAVGVYMVPNADPFKIGGGGSIKLANAQYIASSIALNGAGTSLTMKVDPNSAVTLHQLQTVGLIR